MVKEVFLRSTSNYDALYENCYIETLKSKDIQQFEIAASKRDGTQTLVSADANFRGMYFSHGLGMLYYVIGNTVYKTPVDSSTFSPTVVGTLPTSSGDVGFTDFLYSTGTVKLVWCDGNRIGTIDEFDNIVTSTSPNVPGHIQSPVYLDGYIFIPKAGGQDIYNSALDDPLTWNNEYISAEMSPDGIRDIAKIANYIVAFGESSIEFFYDAANVGGSPLSRNDTLYRHTGYMGGKAQIGNKLFFVGSYSDGNADIFVLEDTKLSSIGAPQVIRTINRTQIDDNNIYGAVVTFNGMYHYVFSVGNSTFAYNINNDMYTNWKYGNTTSFKIKDTANYDGNRFKKSYFLMPTGTANGGILGQFVLDNYTDNGTPYTMVVRTDDLYNDTLQMKFISRLSIFCDRGNTNATIQLRWTDDDYQTYSNPVPIVLNQELASVRRLGGYRRRAFEFSNSENYPVRIWGYELDLNMGSS
ncbi:MAG TPA: packaged DNA stabilization protein [Methanosarcina sp.]|nr:packaged DNA stabilization protein [Methanosarcina sp.]